jgi:hypothetical protein
MTACVNCGRELQSAWKYCISCGTRTTVATTAPRSRPLPGPAASERASAPARTPVPAPFARTSTAPTPDALDGAPAPLRSAIATAEVPAPTLPVAPEPGPTREPRPVIGTGAGRAGRINVLAVLALVLAVLASPLAALFGHIALSQLRTTRERGVIPAWVAIVLGYLWLGFFLVLGISYLASNG